MPVQSVGNTAFDWLLGVGTFFLEFLYSHLALYCIIYFNSDYLTVCFMFILGFKLFWNLLGFSDSLSWTFIIRLLVNW